jgi:hypothetical protein
MTNAANKTPEPTAAAPSVCDGVMSPLLPGFVGAQARAAAAQLSVRQVSIMTSSDMLGMALFGGFGLWWFFAPTSVVGFYTWFTRGRVKLPRSGAIRLIGAGWFILVVVAVVFGRKQ